MLKEYALDPSCLKDWSTFRYLIENFGISQGRLIAEFPRRWFRMVFESCGTFTFLQRQKLEMELQRIKNHGLCRSSRPYDGTMEWLQNALSQHRLDPFDAIISCASDPVRGILGSGELTHTDPQWRAVREKKVARTPASIGAAVLRLLQMSEHILFIDKFFDPEIDRWRDVLLHLFGVAVNRPGSPPILEYHTKIDNDEYGKPADLRTEEFKELCGRMLSDGMPPGSRLKVCRWDQKHGGDFFHARYILTEKGGVRIDWGLDSGKPGEKTDVSLLDDTLWKEYWDWFQEDSSVLELVDSVVIESSS